jgi:predicted Abi (CAAX) family protease
LSSPTDPKSAFSVAPSGVGVYEFQLVVTDPASHSASDRTSIRLFDVDLTFTPPPGTQLSATAERAMTISASYAGLPTGTVLHAELCASVAGATPSDSKVLTVEQDFKIQADNAPDPTFAAMMAFLAGRGCALVRIGEVQSGAGTLSASIRLTPPTLSAAYNQILVNAYGFDPITDDITVIWTLGDLPAPVFPIAQ